MSWQIFLTISILCESFGRVLQRFLLKDGAKVDPMAYAVWAQFLSGFLLLIYAFIAGFKVPSNVFTILPNLLLMLIAYTGMNIFVYKALNYTEASVFTVLFAARVIFIVLGATILLKEPFSVKQISGTALIILSIVIISFKKQNIKFKKGELFSLLAGLFLAVGAINDTYVLKVFDVKSYSPFGFLIPSFLIWGLNLRSSKNIIKLPRLEVFPGIVLLAAIYSASYLFYNLAYFSGNNAGQMAAIYQITSVLTVILAIILLKERSKLLIKLLAAILGFIGVLLIS